MSGIMFDEKDIHASSWRVFKGLVPSIIGLSMVMLRHPVMTLKMVSDIRNDRKKIVANDKTRKLPYQIPPFRPEMKHLVSKQVYQRPTRGIECNAPEIVAMAHRLGAFKKSDWDYAYGVFDFVKRDIIISFNAPLRGAVGSLKHGEGTCLDKTQLFIALCRAAGIPGRIRMSQEVLTKSMLEGSITDSIAIEWYNKMGYFLLHAMAEVYINGKWEPADFSTDYGLEACFGLPIFRLGDEPEGTWNWPVPGSVIRCEAYPFVFISCMKIAFKMSSSMMCVYQNAMEEKIDAGRKVIAEAGGIEAYDRRARQTHKAAIPEVSKRLFKALKESELASKEVS
jgi:hypothetical protein